MATQPQIAANRQNAKLSTGPLEAGQAVAKLNANSTKASSPPLSPKASSKRPTPPNRQSLNTKEPFDPSQFGFVWSEEEIFQSVSQMKVRPYAREAQNRVDELDYKDVPKAAEPFIRENQRESAARSWLRLS
jgi:hypothetical protein